MKNTLLIIVCCISYMGFSQSPLKIATSSNPTIDVQSGGIDVFGLAVDNDLSCFLIVVNEGTVDLTLHVVRTEVYAFPGTENDIVWRIGYPSVLAGSQPIYVSQFSETIAIGDTIHNFAAHYYPNNIDGCSLFKYEWIDTVTNSVYGSVFVSFSHSSSACVVGVQEDNISFEMYPNPSDAEVNFSVEGVNGELEYEISNLLGQKEVSVQLGSANNSNVKVNTSDLSSGVYFVAIKSNGKVIKTEKLVIKH